MYENRPTRQHRIPARLRKQYGLRLVREPLVSVNTVPLRQKLSAPREVWEFMRDFVAQEFAESFWALPLDVQFCCEAPVTITRGLLTTSLGHPRELFRAMIAANAMSVVLCHNHPGNDPSPSDDDRRLTQALVAAGRLLDIPVTDHVIVTPERYFSFMESDLL